MMPVMARIRFPTRRPPNPNLMSRKVLQHVLSDCFLSLLISACVTVSLCILDVDLLLNSIRVLRFTPQVLTLCGDSSCLYWHSRLTPTPRGPCKYVFQRRRACARQPLSPVFELVVVKRIEVPPHLHASVASMTRREQGRLKRKESFIG